MSDRVQSFSGKMTVDEKVAFVAGADMWHTAPVERLGLPAMKVTDGPNGARGNGLLGTGTPTACIPSGASLGASWDPDLLRSLGELLAVEAIAKSSQVLLAPTINLVRSPKGGRNFECFSEDPLLTGVLAAALIDGVQSQGVATTPKHFVGNDSEYERTTINSIIDERTLREVSLLPFEYAVRVGGAWGLMSAYNRLNGTYCSENEWLLQTVLRQQWGFDGFVVTDWFANGTAEGSVAAGLSLEMPGPGRFYGAALAEAVAQGTIDEAALDPLVTDTLTVMERTGLLDRTDHVPAPNDGEHTLDHPEHRALIRRAAASGSVLLRNRGLLPLDASNLGSVALIGPNALQAKVMGGGSAKVKAYRESSPLDALQDRYRELDVRYAQGADIDRIIPPIGRSLLDGVVTVEYRNGTSFDGPADAVVEQSETTLRAFGSPAPGVDDGPWTARMVAEIRPHVSGLHRFTLTQCGQTRLLVNGELCVDATAESIPRGESFFGFGSEEMAGDVVLPAGETARVEVEFSNHGAPFLAGVIVGAAPLVERDLLAEAEALAAQCDVAVVVAGTNDDWETEGRDRDLWELPGDQPELIRRVAAANPRTVVVLNVGSPHCLDWLELPAAVLSVGFAGQELGDALVDMLFGESEPSGRASSTVGARYEHFGAYLNYPGANSEVRYGESVFCGHRWHDSVGIEPAVPFGYGLGYTTFDISAPVPTMELVAGESLSVQVTVRNTGERTGSEVVQVYVEPLDPQVVRPVRELKAFRKVELVAGASTDVTFTLGPRAFAHYDPGDPQWSELSASSLVPAGEGARHRAQPGWSIDPGRYLVHVGRSSRDFTGSCLVTISGEASLDPTTPPN